MELGYVTKVWRSKSKGGYGKGCFNMGQPNLAAAGKVLKDHGYGRTELLSLIFMASHMNSDNYIKRVNYPDLEKMSCGILTEQTVKQNKVFERLKECNLIWRNDDKEVMINPRFAFHTEWNRLEELGDMYTQFKETDEFPVHYMYDKKTREFEKFF